MHCSLNINKNPWVSNFRNPGVLALFNNQLVIFGVGYRGFFRFHSGTVSKVFTVGPVEGRVVLEAAVAIDLYGCFALPDHTLGNDQPFGVDILTNGGTCSLLKAAVQLRFADKIAVAKLFQGGGPGQVDVDGSQELGLQGGGPEILLHLGTEDTFDLIKQQDQAGDHGHPW